MGSIWGQEKEARGAARLFWVQLQAQFMATGKQALCTFQGSPWPFMFRTSSLFCLYLWSRAGLPSLGNPSPPAQSALCPGKTPHRIQKDRRDSPGSLVALPLDGKAAARVVMPAAPVRTTPSLCKGSHLA